MRHDRDVDPTPRDKAQTLRIVHLAVFKIVNGNTVDSTTWHPCHVLFIDRGLVPAAKGHKPVLSYVTTLKSDKSPGTVSCILCYETCFAGTELK